MMKYMHLMDEAMNLERPEIAVMCVLMLRGPQTVGEIRTRSGRLFEFQSLEEVEATLNVLATRSPALATRLARQPGQKEARYAHLLSGEVEASTAPAATRGHSQNDGDDRISRLEQELEQLRGEVIDLRQQLTDLRKQFE